MNNDKNTNTMSTTDPGAQENYTAACFLEEAALNSFCQEAIPLWEEAIQKMGEARKDYEYLRKSDLVLDEQEEDALNRALAKVAWYEAQRADCVARVAQDRAMDATRFTKDQIDRWEEAIQEATKAKEAWFKAEQVYDQFLQKAHKIVKEWWSQEYHAVVNEKENATRDLNWCKDRKEALILAAREKPSEEEIKKFKAIDVLECWTEKTLHPGRKKRVSILKTDLNFSLIRREEVFELVSRVVLSKQEMVANYLLLTLKEGANSELICGRLGLDADSIQNPTSIYSSFYRLCLKEPFLKSWADVMEKIDRDKKLPVEQQQFAMIETVEPDSFWSLNS